VVQVETTQQMATAVREALPSADVLVMAAAPADFTVADVPARKLKKSERPDTLSLTSAPDILLTTRDSRPEGAVIVGFALETGDAIAEASRKLRDKQLDIIVANDATEAGAGFGTSTNRVTLLDASGNVDALELMSKRDVAAHILDRVERRLRGR
jgi:phosphopantothenoylcysteine decarboxylase/phosphopantothenate--cysteine ligase